MNERTTILYIAGMGRSGSTLLANILGTAPCWFSAGEVRYVWERGFVENRQCGCGNPFCECSLWSQIAERSHHEHDMMPLEMTHTLNETVRIRSIPRLVSTIARDPATRPDAFRRMFAQLERMYVAIAEVSGASVIIDSSKLPTYGYMIDKIPSLDVRVLHLMRDPCANAYSWKRDRASGALSTDLEPMDQFTPLKSSMLWSLWNLAPSVLWNRRGKRYLRVRYEDFLRDPKRWTAEILRWAGDRSVEESTPPFTDDHTCELGTNHNVAGNPNRLRTGPTVLKPDDAWRRGLPRATAAMVRLLTAPVALPNGYPRRGAVATR